MDCIKMRSHMSSTFCAPRSLPPGTLRFRFRVFPCGGIMRLTAGPRAVRGGSGGIAMTRKIAVLLPFLAALALFALASAADAPGPFTLEQVMSAPFPGELVAAPAAGQFAWLQNARGVRNIWVAEPASPGQADATGAYTARQVTPYKADDGVDIGELRWTPDAQTLLYTRGADLE